MAADFFFTISSVVGSVHYVQWQGSENYNPDNTPKRSKVTSIIGGDNNGGQYVQKQTFKEGDRALRWTGRLPGRATHEKLNAIKEGSEDQFEFGDGERRWLVTFIDYVGQASGDNYIYRIHLQVVKLLEDNRPTFT